MPPSERAEGKGKGREGKRADLIEISLDDGRRSGRMAGWLCMCVCVCVDGWDGLSGGCRHGWLSYRSSAEKSKVHLWLEREGK